MSSLLVFTPINLITYSTHSKAFSPRNGHERTIEVQKSNIYFYCHVYDYAHTLHLRMHLHINFHPECVCERMQPMTKTKTTQYYIIEIKLNVHAIYVVNCCPKKTQFSPDASIRHYRFRSILNYLNKFKLENKVLKMFLYFIPIFIRILYHFKKFKTLNLKNLLISENGSPT